MKEIILLVVFSFFISIQANGQLYFCVGTQSYSYEIKSQTLKPIPCVDYWDGPRFYHPWSQMREYRAGLDFLEPGDFSSPLKTQWSEFAIDLTECTSPKSLFYKFKNTIILDRKSDNFLFWSYYVDYLGQLYLSNAMDTKIGTKPIIYRTNNYEGGDPVLSKLDLDLDINFLLSDMTVYKDKLLVLGFEGKNNFLFHFNVNSLELIKKIPIDFPITQLASIVQDCDSIQMYGFLNFKNSEIGEIDTVHVYKLNVESGILSDHTSFVAPDLVFLVNNVISPSEFLASETNCDLLIDLDRNNSGLLFPYDFSPEDRLCFGNTAKIADEDTYIHTSYPLSHIDIFLKDVRDQGNEQLLFSGLPGINFTDSGNGVYRLQGSSPNTPDSIYALALKNITYQNTALPKTYGVRDIQIVGSNAAKTGDTIHSYITVGITISSDTFVCGKDVFPYEGKDYFAGDTIAKWLLADSGCDTLIEIYVKSHAVPIISITGDQLLCFDSAVTLISNDHWSYLWSQKGNYSATNEFITNQDDEIMLTVTNEFGCKKDTSIFLQKGIDFTTTIPDLVNVEEGDTMWIDLGLQGDVLDEVIINPNSGLYYLEDRLLFNGFSSQEYALTLQGEGGCSLSKNLFLDVVLKDLKSRIPNIVQSFSQLNNTVNFDLGDGVSILGCAIYDRWGNQVYSCSDSENNAWHTTIQNQSAETGVYSYFLQYELKNGKTDFLYGDITVLK